MLAVRPPRTSDPLKRPNRSQRKAYAYARCQDLMANCPKKLADMVVANDLSAAHANRAPPKDDVRRLYSQLWGLPGPNVPRFERTRDPIPIEDVLRPITPSQIEHKLSKISSRSAAGPDGLTKTDLTKSGRIAALAVLFNLLLLKGHYPLAWRTNRTTLIPKAGKDPSDVKNWRPITISSLVSRLFAGLLDSRLRAVLEQTERQKGFTEENGCYSNIQLLNAALAQAKQAGGVVTVLDVAKAFDTVPHSAISECLERKGIPSEVALFVAGMYHNCTTKIRSCDGEVEIELKRGVKQGDPLSPLLFNLVIEPIVERLNNGTNGLTVEGHGLAVLAFADDLVLIANDRGSAQDQLELVRNGLLELDMQLSVPKCSTFAYVPAGKTWYITNPQLELDKILVPHASPGEAFKYLGVRISPWKGLLHGFEIETYRELIGRVRALPLKPMQRIDLLSTYLLPRYTYGLITSPPA